ncbi:Beta-galactosidase protein [Dioscorea alata]|uniref:Beta-galactosidase protein n=1 Tax=Dioscorea alata TaxID=55571 RepID=A0ACB7U884_DIOAL|nr:Beta-galactosidase protein [Dioscorea alata]
MSSFILPSFTSLVLILLHVFVLVSSTEVTHDGRAIIIDGEKKLLFSGSIHYPRSTPEMWPHLIRKAKLGGLDAIETYVFWNAHEPRQREYNFEGNLDLIRFLKEIKNAGLYSVLRIGPYACAEWNYGGFPVWLRNIPGLQFRTDNIQFENEMQNFTTLIVNMIKNEQLLAPQGGPIILAQIENEYGNIMKPFGEAGKRYVQWCAKMAESQNIGVPWVMCQQPDAPQPMINTCNGFYCDSFKPNNPKSPKMWTENWTGWFQKWSEAKPHRRAEDLAFSVARFFQTGGTFQNYYMYHGGTNFGRFAGGPYISTTYDYDAPLDEYGNLRQPKWGHLKELHAAIKMIDKALLQGNATDTDLGNGVTATKYTDEGNACGCFLSNINMMTDFTVVFEGAEYFLPAWSVSVAPDCKLEVYNTAKVNTEIHIMIKKPDTCKEGSQKLSWSWLSEMHGDNLKGVGSFSAHRLLEQTSTTVDDSDYLWYMTSVDVKEKEVMVLSVNTTGHVLHAFVNGELVGSQYSLQSEWNFVFEKNVSLNAGINYISLLSATVGLENYGSFFEYDSYGIVGGPVKLIGNGNNSIDLTKNKWSYKIGLNGMEKHQVFADENCNTKSLQWKTDYIPTLRPFTWYKANFDAPIGDEPVVVDLLGMGKGAAWVNGNSLGRFWPNYTADPNACKPCDYRGQYTDSRCRTDCGEPSQRWYHVPRSFLKAGLPNTLVLFEEFGGDPLGINFQTVTVGTTCAKVDEGKTLALTCQAGRLISDITFAAYSDIQGECGSFKTVKCESCEPVLSLMKQECIGKPWCSIDVANEKLGVCASCAGIPKKLAVEAVCS